MWNVTHNIKLYIYHMVSLHIISYEIYQICDNKYITLLVSCLSLIWHIFNESSRRTRCLVDPVDPWSLDQKRCLRPAPQPRGIPSSETLGLKKIEADSNLANSKKGSNDIKYVCAFPNHQGKKVEYGLVIFRPEQIDLHQQICAILTSNLVCLLLKARNPRKPYGLSSCSAVKDCIGAKQCPTYH